jgi:capsular polysaccharide biosynthesis protein
MTTTNSNIPENEIDKLLNILKEYRVMIVILTLLFTMSAGVYALFVHKPIYQATALIQLGKENTFVVEDENTLREKLIATYRIYTDPNQPLPRITDVMRPKYSKALLQLTAQGRDKGSLKQMLTQKLSELQKEHNTTITKYINDQTKRLNSTTNVIKRSKIEIQKLKEASAKDEKRLQALEDSELAELSILTVKIVKNEAYITRLEDKIDIYAKRERDLKKTLLPMRTLHTDLVDSIDVHSKPITPSKSIIIVVGFVSGLLLSVFIAIFMSLLGSRRA